MKNFRVSECCILLVVTGLSACATVNKVDMARLNEAKDRVFRVGKVTIPCDALRRLPTGFVSIAGKKHQLALLEGIPTDEVLQVLAESYGLNVSFGGKMKVDSNPVHFSAFFSKNVGRCWNLENELGDENGNTVDIEYTLTELMIPLMPIKMWIGYIITVQSNGSILIKHKGEVASVEYPFLGGFPPDDVFDKIKGYIRDIPVALQRDIMQNIAKYRISQ